MRCRRFGNRYLIRLAAGEEVITALKAVCRRARVQSATFVGLGSVTGITLGLFRHGDRKFHSDVIPGVFAEAPFAGTIIASRGLPRVLCRINLDGGPGTPSRGGQLNSALVSDACEIVLSLTDGIARPAGSANEDCRQLEFAA